MTETFKAYQNKDGFCSFYSIGTAIESALDIVYTEQDIQDFFKLYDTTKRGLRVNEICSILKTKPYKGVQVESFRQPLNIVRPQVANLVTELNRLQRDPHYEIIVSLWGRDKKSWLKLDDESRYIPDKSAPKSSTKSHAVYLQKIHTLPGKMRNFTGITLLNNWGPDWGDQGYFYMSWEDFLSEAMHITGIKFTYAPEA